MVDQTSGTPLPDRHSNEERDKEEFMDLVRNVMRDTIAPMAQELAGLRDQNSLILREIAKLTTLVNNLLNRPAIATSTKQQNKATPPPQTKEMKKKQQEQQQQAPLKAMPPQPPLP